MSRGVYVVDISGAWERKSDGQEWGMHRVLRLASRVEGFRAEFRMDRAEHITRGVRTRTGTFGVENLRVLASSHARANVAARAYVRAFVIDLCCGSPKLTFNRPSRTKYLGGIVYVREQDAKMVTYTASTANTTTPGNFSITAVR